MYVDDARISRWGRRWSHLVADSEDELHRAAATLGIGPERVQSKGRTLHYDLPEERRLEAIATGVASPISWRELVQMRAGLARGRR